MNAAPKTQARAMSGVSLMPLILTPFGEYEARLRAIDKTAEANRQRITESAAELSRAADQLAATVEVERKAAFARYRAALKAAN